MAHESSRHGQPSPPHSNQDEYRLVEYNHSQLSSHGMHRPYTPPMPHPSQQYSYGDPSEYEMRATAEYYDQPSFYQERTYRTPPQPITSSGIQTRSGRSLGTPASSSSPSSRMSQSPRPRKNRGGKEKQEYKIHEPLSTMTSDYDEPVEDMMAWANRSAEDRHAEVTGKHKGKVPRPMNSFMLYRMAYKARIKKWGAQGDNNQLISSVAGNSWNFEPKEIKDFYAKVAIVERDNHTAAFPNYKFAPNKTPKKRERDDDEETDGEWDGGPSYSGKRRRGRFDRDVTRSRSTTPAQVMYASPGCHPSSYQASNPHMIPTMAVYDGWSQPTQYDQPYQYDQFAYHRQPQAVQYGPTSIPASHDHYLSQQLVGLPPTTDRMLEHEQVGRPDFAIDPGLGEYMPATSYEYGTYPDPDYGHDRQVYLDETEAVIHPGLQTLAPPEGFWSPNASGYDENAFDRELSG